VRLGVRLQIFLAFTTLLILGGVGAGILMFRWLSEEMEDVVASRCAALSGNLATWCEDAVLTEDRVGLNGLVRATKASNEEIVYIYILDPRGRLLAHSFDGRFSSELQSATAGRPRMILSTEAGSVLDVRAGILQGRGGEVHVGYSRRRMLRGVRRLKMMVWLISIPVLLLGTMAIVIMSGYLARPARELTEAARRLGSGDLDARVSERFRGEMGTLSVAFNQMAANLQRQAGELRFLNEYNQNLVDNLGMGVYVLDKDFTVQYANRELTREFGEIEGRRCHEALCGSAEPCEGCIAVSSRESNVVQRRTCNLPNGHWVEQTAIPLADADGSDSTIVTRRDITEDVRIREQITQHEKLAAVGQLAAVVAHEVNNPLDGMHSLVRLAVDDPGLSSDSARHLRMVDDGLSRLEMIVRRLLTFTADQAEPTLSTTIEEQLDRALQFVGTRLESCGVDVRLQFEPDPAPVIVDPNRFPQVVVNLLLNAADAMPEGGTLTVRGERLNSSVCVTFEDEGTGVPEDMRESIFEPFFTTKEPGRGTGLGLAISQRIVEGHGGTLTVKEPQGGGAAFVICLPADRTDGISPGEDPE
jgi:C4-dicarboxylate-specific signal transduction histidine kinase